MSNDNKRDERQRPYTGPAMRALEQHKGVRFEVLQFTEYEPGKSRTVRLGSAFVNKDGSINLLLDALPALLVPDKSGKPVAPSLQLREPEPRQQDGRR